MQVPTISMPVDKARAKLKAFRRKHHKDAERIYARWVWLTFGGMVGMTYGEQK